MIAVITIIIVVSITIGIISTIKIYKNKKEIKELERTLDEYYKRRENRLMERFRDIDNMQ